MCSFVRAHVCLIAWLFGYQWLFVVRVFVCLLACVFLNVFVRVRLYLVVCLFVGELDYLFARLLGL